MSIEDPTITTLTSYELSGAEAFVGLLSLVLTVLLEAVKKFRPSSSSNFISLEVSRTPEDSFKGVRESQGSGNYIYIQHEGQRLRIHYVDEGNPNGSKVLLLLHGEPFWSHSYRRLIPYLVKSQSLSNQAPSLLALFLLSLSSDTKLASLSEQLIRI